MKNKILPVLFALAVVFTTNQASAYYSPSTGRWLSRDPSGELGFETLRASSVVPRIGQVASTASLPPSRIFIRDAAAHKQSQGIIYVDSDPNNYAFADNNSIAMIDVFGLDPGYGNPVSGPDGPVGPSDPYAPGGPYGPVYNPPPPSCNEACVLKYLLGIEVDTTVIISGQPIIDKRFIMVGSTEGTSIAGQMTSSILGDMRFPGNTALRSPTSIKNFCCLRIPKTPVVSRFISRWIPVYGWVKLGYDSAGLAGCLCGCNGI